MYKLFKRSHQPGLFEVQIAGVCDTGIARDHNEDAIAIQEDDGRGYYLALVCDGMGGHNAGEIASALAVGVILEHVEENFRQRSPRELLLESFALANARIDQQAEQNPDARGMGCTAVMLLGVKDKLWIAHAGDSRGYRTRNGTLERITVDHTMVQEMLDNGLLTAEQAAMHPYRGRISRCLGHAKNRSEPDIDEATLDKGDNVLLCSDGLSDVTKDEEIQVLIGQRDVRMAARRLVEAANKAGGPDNISAVVIRRVM